MRVGDQVEILPYRIHDCANPMAYDPYPGEIVDVRGIIFKRYTVAFLSRDAFNPERIITKLCVMRRGQLSPLYDAPASPDGFKYGA